MSNQYTTDCFIFSLFIGLRNVRYHFILYFSILLAFILCNKSKRKNYTANTLYDENGLKKAQHFAKYVKFNLRMKYAIFNILTRIQSVDNLMRTIRKLFKCI